jgi:hypothetical protein
MNTKQAVTWYQKLCNKEYVYYSTLVSKEVKNCHKTSKKLKKIVNVSKEVKNPHKTKHKYCGGFRSEYQRSLKTPADNLWD